MSIICPELNMSDRYQERPSPRLLWPPPSRSGRLRFRQTARLGQGPDPIVASEVIPAEPRSRPRRSLSRRRPALPLVARSLTVITCGFE